MPRHWLRGDATDQRLEAIIRGIPDSEFAKIAAGALGAISERPVQALTFAEITTPHGERRTIGIVRVAGTAGGKAWSTVAKILDLAVEPDARIVNVTAPENEEIVYEEGYFANNASGLRPARCYHISRPSDGLKIFWLEDLSAAKGPPFTLAQIAQIARHFGEWNGANVGRPVELKFPVRRDFYAKRYDGWGFDRRLAELRALEDHPRTLAIYRDHPITLAAEIHSLLQRLNEATRSCSHGLAFGDCSAGNIFHRPGETIAIDWASLCDDPIGVDGGCVIGSSMTWGADYADAALHERALFDSYVEGLVAGGWRGRRDDVRRGYFGQFGFYLGTTTTLPIMLTGKVLPLEFIEKRYGLPVDEIAARAAPVVDLFPGYVAELRALLD